MLGGLLGFGGPAQATFPGRNGRIAYSVGPIFPQEPPAPSQIFTINPDGSGRRQLTDVPADKTAGSPAWSPDGRRIVFSRCNVQFGFSAYCDIDRIDADGSHRRTLVAGNWFHERARYSPDGRKLAFFSNKGGFQGAVWTADADGGNRRGQGGRQPTHPRPGRVHRLGAAAVCCPPRGPPDRALRPGDRARQARCPMMLPTDHHRPAVR